MVMAASDSDKGTAPPWTKMTTIAETMALVSSLSVPQHQVLRALAVHAEPVTVGTIAAQMGLKTSAVRETLTSLVESGAVTRQAHHTQKKGRPSWLYSATVTTDPEQIMGEFAALAAAVAEMISEDCKDADYAAEQLGRKWGRKLLERQSIPDHSHIDVDNEVMGKQFLAHAAKIRWFLSRLGFAASAGTEDNQIELHQCPFMEEDPQRQSIVCHIHAGMISQVITTLSKERLEAKVIPLSGPGFCQVDLVPGVMFPWHKEAE